MLRPIAGSVALLGAFANCNAVLGLGDFTDEASSSSSSGAGGETTSSSSSSGTGGASSSSTSTSSSSGGPGGSGSSSTSSSSGGMCPPGDMKACFTGAPGTENVGACKDGTATCDPQGQAYGPCKGEVGASPESCENPIDEDCDGHDCAVWAELFGDAALQHIAGLHTDGQGNIYVAGSSAGSVVLDANTTLTGTWTWGFLIKFDPTGKVLWAKSFGAPQFGPMNMGDLAVNAAGDVAIVGDVGAINFGGANLTGGNFVAKFDSTGAHVFSFNINQMDDTSFPTRVALDGNGTVAVFGTETCFQACQPANTNLFLWRYDKNGAAGWGKAFAAVDNGGQVAGGVAFDQAGNVLIAGGFTGTDNFGGANQISAGATDAFVTKFDPTGVHLWDIHFGDAAAQAASDVTTDSTGNVYVLGNFKGAINPGGGIVTSAGGTDMFLAKYSGTKVFSFQKTYGSAGEQSGNRLAVDANNRIVFTTTIAGSVDFGGGSLAAAAGLDSAMAKLNADGTHLWSRIFPGPGDQGGFGVATNASFESFLTLDVTGSIDVGTGVLTSAGASDFVVAKFAP